MKIRRKIKVIYPLLLDYSIFLSELPSLFAWLKMPVVIIIDVLQVGGENGYSICGYCEKEILLILFSDSGDSGLSFLVRLKKL